MIPIVSSSNGSFIRVANSETIVAEPPHVEPEAIKHKTVTHGQYTAALKMTEKVFEGLFCSFEGQMSSVLVADSLDIPAKDRLALYVQGLFKIFGLKNVPIIRVSSSSEAIIYAILGFGPRSGLSQMAAMKARFDLECVEKQKQVFKGNLEIAGSVDMKALLGIPQGQLTEEEQDYLDKTDKCYDKDDLYTAYWDWLYSLPYPQNFVILDPGKLSSWSDPKALQIWISRAAAYQTMMNRRWPVRLLTPQGDRQIALEIFIDKSKGQLHLKKMEIEGQPIVKDSKLDDESKFTAYIDMISSMFTKSLAGYDLNGLPCIWASCPEEAKLLYYMGFDKTEGTNELRPYNADFREWVKYWDPDHDDADFRRKVLSRIPEYLAAPAIEISPMVLPPQPQPPKIHSETHNATDWVTRFDSSSVRIRKYGPPHNCAIIQKVEFVKGCSLPDATPILAGALYIAMQKSFEWGYAGEVKVVYGDDQQAQLFQLIDFHNPNKTEYLQKIFSGETSKAALEKKLKKKHISPTTLLLPVTTAEKVSSGITDPKVLYTHLNLKEAVLHEDFPVFYRVVADAVRWSNKVLTEMLPQVLK